MKFLCQTPFSTEVQKVVRQFFLLLQHKYSELPYLNTAGPFKHLVRQRKLLSWKQEKQRETEQIY